jgi:hypothetical protein
MLKDHKDCPKEQPPLEGRDYQMRVVATFCCGDCRLWAKIPNIDPATGDLLPEQAGWCCDYGHDTRDELRRCVEKALARGVQMQPATSAAETE